VRGEREQIKPGQYSALYPGSKHWNTAGFGQLGADGEYFIQPTRCFNIQIGTIERMSKGHWHGSHVTWLKFRVCFQEFDLLTDAPKVMKTLKGMPQTAWVTWVFLVGG